MTSLIIIAKIVAKAESIEQVKVQLLKLIAPTLKEEGCIQYKLNQDLTNQQVFIFYEEWQSRELWQVHMENANLAACNKAIENLIESVEVYEMQSLN